MDQILNKVGSYWLGQKANKEINSVGDDINVILLILCLYVSLICSISSLISDKQLL